ncbi:MAG: SDR family NAD(P)-dependent oxidoreductase [Actinobacteria bacterium]|nr:SDR family NAD(P)-dependent oxidoreductase [Actinomycetota bacterium]
MASSRFNASAPAGSIARERRKCSISWSSEKSIVATYTNTCSLFQIENRCAVRDDAGMTIEISLTGRTALVVGGGGGGIGSSVCHRLADAGADIVALSAVAADLDATQAEVEQRGQQCTSAVVDVHDLETLRSTIENNPEVDLVVNVVGGVTVPHWHRLHDYPIESFDHLLTTNLRYAFTSCQAVAARLIADARPGAMSICSRISLPTSPARRSTSMAARAAAHSTSTTCRCLSPIRRSGPASSPEESPQATRYRPGSTSTASPRSSMRATWSSAVRRSTRSTIDIST